MSLVAISPLYQAYLQSDFFGKLIFLGLFGLSILSWLVIVHKYRMTRAVSRVGDGFQRAFHAEKQNLLALPTGSTSAEFGSPFQELYQIFQKQTLGILGKNQQSYLSASDVGLVEVHLMSGIASIVKRLDKNLFILSTIVSLAPFLGLLGTVWGILTTLSELQTQSLAGGSQMVLGGLSMALATTVLGLVIAIPALVGHSYFRQVIRDFTVEMENFSSEMVGAVEMQYRKVDVT